MPADEKTRRAFRDGIGFRHIPHFIRNWEQATCTLMIRAFYSGIWDQIMGHRYLQPMWWARRLAQPAESIVSPSFIIGLLARAERLGGEPELRVLDRIVPRDRIAVDIGAADGVYAWHLARIATGCIAFEANPVVANRLRARLPQVEVYEIALSDSFGAATLRIPLLKGVELNGHATVEEANRLQGCVDVRHAIVQKRTFDSFSFPPIGFMKIDVEGHEISVLRGAEKTILRDHPAILVEVENRHSLGAVDSVSSWLSARGYEEPTMAGSPQNLLFRATKTSYK